MQCTLCVRIEDEGRRPVRREEMRKQKAGLETKRQVEFARNLLAIGRATHFARSTQYDTTRGEKKEGANPDDFYGGWIKMNFFYF